VTGPSPHDSCLLFGLLPCLLNLGLTAGLFSLGFFSRSIALRFGLVLLSWLPSLTGIFLGASLGLQSGVSPSRLLPGGARRLE
jgi:hypothetical protein